MSFLHLHLPPHQVSSLMPNTMGTFQPTFYLTSQLQLAQIINFSFRNILFSWIPWLSYSLGFPPISLTSLSISYFHFSFSTSSLNIRVVQNLVVDIVLTLFLTLSCILVVSYHQSENDNQIFVLGPDPSFELHTYTSSCFGDISVIYRR